MTATVASDLKETTAFRCTVTVGDGNDDEKAVDTKLIYAQKIKVVHEMSDLQKEHGMIVGESLKVKIYGGDAYPLKTSYKKLVSDTEFADSKCELESDSENVDADGSTTITTTATTATNLKCTLAFKTNKDAPTDIAEEFKYTSAETIKVKEACDAGKYWKDDTSGCTQCSDNYYRPDSHSQFEPCLSCPAGEEPNGQSTDCTKCDAGKYSTAESRCLDCDAGYYSENAGAKECTPCAPGWHQTVVGQSSCDSCDAGTYSIGKGLASACEDCPEGSISVAGANKCTYCLAGEKEINNECIACDHGLGQYSMPGSTNCETCSGGTFVHSNKDKCVTCAAGSVPNAGKTGCDDCSVGTYAAPGSSQCISCPAGTYSDSSRSESCSKCTAGHYQDAVGETRCKKCNANEGEYSSLEGSTSCLKCQGQLNGNRCDPCPKDHEFKSNGCSACEKGKYSAEGSGSCQLVPPGTKKVEGSTLDFDDCPAGEKQPQAGQTECVPCDADKGEFQTETGQTYCKTTKPGYQLNGGNPKKEEVKCEKNSYSTGGAKKCTPCDSSKGEYTEADGSTYCNICMGLVDKNGDCGATNCEEDTVILEGVGDGTFVFKTTKVGSTAGVKCEEKSEKDDEITRYCSYNPATRKGEWATADSSKCSSQFTEQVEEQLAKVKEINVTNKEETAKTVQAITDLATNATKMAPQDLSNMATTVSDIAAKFEEAETKVDATEAEGLANTVGSVAGAGEAKLASVTESEKTKMVNTVNIIAKNLDGEKAVETETIAMQKFSKIEVAAPVELPKPKNDAKSPPKLKMRKAALVENKEVAPSVAVFDKETAKAIFPKPTASSSSNSNSTETTGSKTLKVNYTIDSSIVSLEFAGTTELDIEIEIPVDTSEDSGKSGYELTRKCKFYNESKEEWSEDGCKTIEGELSSQTGERSYTCQCTHNTSFAIILSQAEIADTIQTTASTILNTVNIIFLGLTFICIAPFKKFRARRLIQIQVQLCAALFVGHIAFIILGTTTAYSKSCVPGVIIVQYLFLVAVAWSVCASVTLYEKIVNALKSFGKQDKHYFLKCLAGCWTAPLFMVIATYVTTLAMDEKTLPYVTSTGELDDDKTETCWVASPWKWVGFIIPVYLCLGINVVLFVMIARIIIKAGKSGSSTGHAREVKAIMSIATTVCLPWLVALLMTGPPTMAQIFQWIFIIVTSMQGPTMFICFVIFQEDVLTNLFSLIGKEPPQALLPAKSSKSTKSAASEISSIKPTTAAPVKKEEKSDVVQVKNPEYSTPVQQAHHSEENIYSKVDEEAPAEKDDTISRGSRGSKHLYESTSYTQHGDKGDDINPVPAVEQGETYENAAANDLDIAQNTYPHVPQLV